MVGYVMLGLLVIFFYTKYQLTKSEEERKEDAAEYLKSVALVIANPQKHKEITDRLLKQLEKKD